MAVAEQEAVPAPVAVSAASAPVQEAPLAAASAPVQKTKFAPTEVVSGSGPVQRLPLAPRLQVNRTLSSAELDSIKYPYKIW